MKVKRKYTQLLRVFFGGHYKKLKQEKKPFLPPILKNPTQTSIVTPRFATKAATEHLLKNLHQILSSKNYPKEQFTIDLVDDNIYKWRVNFLGRQQPIALSNSFSQNETFNIEVEVLFPPDYPQRPPFLWIVQPRILTSSKFITVGGSICMEQLTRTGWNPKTELYSLLLMVNSLLGGTAWIDTENPKGNNEWEARIAFERVAKENGWEP